MIMGSKNTISIEELHKIVRPGWVWAVNPATYKAVIPGTRTLEMGGVELPVMLDDALAIDELGLTRPGSDDFYTIKVNWAGEDVA